MIQGCSVLLAVRRRGPVPTRPSVDWTFRGRPRLRSSLPDRGLELGQGGHGFLPDGEDPHAGAQAGLEGRAAGDDLIDLDAAASIRSGGGAGRTRNPSDASTSGAAGSSSIVTGSDCGFAFAVERHGDLRADIQAGGQVPQSRPGRRPRDRPA